MGDALFQTHENLEHLAMMQQMGRGGGLGSVPAPDATELAGRGDRVCEVRLWE